jgi:hypothetical protein
MCSKPSQIWLNGGRGHLHLAIMRISETKDSPKKLRTQVNGKFNDINSADENKKDITVNLYLKTIKKTVHLLIDRRLRSCTYFESVE